MLNITAIFDGLQDDNTAADITQARPAAGEYERASETDAGAPDFDLFAEARRIYDRAQTSRRVRASNII